DNVFFGNSGAEANEAAIKIARKHAFNQDIDNPQIITLEGSFHGRTMATLSATGNPKVKAGFAPLVSGFVNVPANDFAAIETYIKQPDTVAVLLEVTQGEGGVNLMSADYLQAVAAACAQHSTLLILDEIQTGNGRTGSYFAYQQCGVLPDVVTTAKGLGNGFPIGACLTRGMASSLLEPGNHGSTFGGNPLACATALTVVNTIINEKLSHNAASMGTYLLEQFKQQLSACQKVVDIRGHGLMIGIELDEPCGDLVKDALAAGLLINVTAGNTVRLLPPLIITQAQADELVALLCPLIKQFG
ncbi:MAG: aminotransferase class III-fold pyridoxal phosphate-dependent enzyme, partial [Pseudomonadota bacterium]